MITQAAFARLIGVHPTALTVHTKPGGKLYPFILRGEGGRSLGIREQDVEAARAAWFAQQDLTDAPTAVLERATARAAAYRAEVAAPVEDPAEWLAAHEGETPAAEPSIPPPRPEPEDPSAHDGMELFEANRIEKIWKARLAELKFKEAAAELVPAVDVRRKLTERLAGLRTALLGIPSQVKQAIPALTTVEVAKVEALVVEALQDLVAEEGE